jgi:hypothetical protein
MEARPRCVRHIMAVCRRDDLSPVPDEDTGSAGKHVPRRKASRRKPSIDEVFGDVLPESTRDDQDPSRDRDSAAQEKAREDELLRDVPPHHG